MTCTIYLFIYFGSGGHNVYVNCMHMMFVFFFAPEFNCLTIWITVKLESSTHALLANSEALWLLALHVVFVLFFLISLLWEKKCLIAWRGQCFQSLAIFTFFSASGVWLVGAECKVPGEELLWCWGHCLDLTHAWCGWHPTRETHNGEQDLKMVMLLVGSLRTQPYSQGHAFQQSL